MNDDDTIINLRKSRDAALLALDLNWARAQWFGAPIPGDELLLITMHKARLEAVSLPVEARKESARWLRDRNLHTVLGAVPDPENLPE